MIKERCIAVLAASTLFATQAGVALGQSDDDGNRVGESSLLSGPSHQLAVFNPDGSSWSITPMQSLQNAIPESIILIATQMPLPERLTVFEPHGVSYAYEFIPLEVAIWDALNLATIEDDTFNLVAALDEDFTLVAMIEPFDVAMDDDIFVEHTVSIDDDTEIHPENTVRLVVARSSAQQAAEDETSS